MTAPPTDAPPSSQPYAEDEPPTPPRRRLRTAALALGVVATLAAGIFAAVALSGEEGSASPEEAVERLLEAISDEDVLGVLEALPPGERSALRPGLEDLTEELRRLGILSEDVDLGGVDGIDLEIEGVQMATEDLGEGVAAVRLTGGTFTTSTQPDELPLGSALRQLLESPDGSGLEAERSSGDLDGDGPIMVTVEEDGGWHVSLFYSLAEVFRDGTGEDAPAFGEGVDPEGAESPEAVVRQVAEAAVALDARRLVALTPPDEMRALHDYAPLFLDEAGEAETPFDVRVDRLDLDPEVDGDVARVRLTGFAFTAGPPGQEITVGYDGDCFTFGADGSEERTCASDMEQMGPGAVSELVVVTVRHDGEWFLSPTRTVFEQLLGGLRVLDPEDVEDLDSFFQGVPPFVPGLGLFGPPRTGTDEAVEVIPPPMEG